MSVAETRYGVLPLEFLARQEREGWLLFDCVSHSVAPVDEEAVAGLENSGKVVRRITRPLLPGALAGCGLDAKVRALRLTGMSLLLVGREDDRYMVSAASITGMGCTDSGSQSV